VSQVIPAAVGGIPAITDREFRVLSDLIYAEAGIRLSPVKKTLLVGRLASRLRELGVTSFGAYYKHVMADVLERARMLERICTHETQFFREPRQFEFMERRVIPWWEARAAEGHRSRRVRAWSAGCASGEEPYSLAMLLLRCFPPESGWEVEVVATDLSAAVLARAQAARWPIAKADQIPIGLRKRFMLKGFGPNAGYMKAGPEVRSVVSFQQLNLNQETYRLAGPFDAVFCRNVLIYFDASSRRRVVERIARWMSPDGLLFLGHAETLNATAADQLHSVGPTVYAATSVTPWIP